MAEVRLEKVTKRFGKQTIIDGIDLQAKDDQLTVFVGPSGCGKSTLLRIIAGLERADSGIVRIDGEPVNDVAPFHRGVAMVFQSYALYPHMTVYENMRFGLISLGVEKSEMDRRIRHAADKLDLTPYLDRKPRQLSGGQRQRVAMGRAMVRSPRVFLFDEPLSNLDASLRGKMRLEIARLRRELNATAIYVTHDQVEAMTLADKIVVLRAGRIEQEGTPLEVYRKPVNKFVASFLGSPAMNFVPVTSEGNSVHLPDGSRIGVRLALTSEQGKNVELGLRPEQLSLRADLPCSVEGHVYAVEHLGDQALVHLKVAEGNVTARFLADETLPTNGTMRFYFDPAQAMLFDAGGTALPSELEGHGA